MGSSTRSTRLAGWRWAVLAGAVAVAACGPAAQTATVASSGDAWRDFEGTWTAAGSRQKLGLGDGRQASIASLDGTLLLAGPGRPGVGFRAEAIVLYDSATGMTGRAAWTDEHGDQAFSELNGEGTPSGNRIFGTFVGGTGRYAGATGRYEFAWRFMLETDDGSVQGQSVGLKGRIRVEPPKAAAFGGSARP